MACHQPTAGSRTAGVKRTRPAGNERPRKSARLEGICQGRQTAQTQTPQESLGRKRTQTHIDETLLGSRAERRRRWERPAKLSKEEGSTSEEEQDPIAYWSQHSRWPPSHFKLCGKMVNILARKRSTTSRSRKNSEARSITPSSATPSDQRPREEKSAGYRDPRYKVLLATNGVFMDRSELGVLESSKVLCRDLFAKDQSPPEGTLFDDDIFEDTCKMVEDRNEAKVIQDITRLVVPSAQVLAVRGAKHLKRLTESVNEGWNNCITVTKTRPQPDYAVGFRREAFTQAQLNRMQPIVGDLMDQSYFMATYYMYFPFLSCEVKCGAAALDIADRQNAHSMAIAARAIVELFRAVKREKELHRDILAFSISHDHRTVRIYGHYAEVDEPEPRYYRYLIRTFDFTELDGREKWTAYKFTRNIYDVWMPRHFERICSAIEEIPPDVSFAMSESELHFTEQPGLSQDVSAYSIAPSSGDSRSVQAQGTRSSVLDNPSSTPSTSLDGGAFKKPRRNRDGGQK